MYLVRDGTCVTTLVLGRSGKNCHRESPYSGRRAAVSAIILTAVPELNIVSICCPRRGLRRERRAGQSHIICAVCAKTNLAGVLRILAKCCLLMRRHKMIFIAFQMTRDAANLTSSYAFYRGSAAHLFLIPKTLLLLPQVWLRSSSEEVLPKSIVVFLRKGGKRFALGCWQV